jgi:ABC-type multidrug transport system fused ATPase/permease subunit
LNVFFREEEKQLNKEEKFNYFSCFCFLWGYAKSYWHSFLIFYTGYLFDYALYIVVPIISGIMIDQIVYYQNISIFLKLGLLQFSFVIFYSYVYFFTQNQHSYLTSHFTYNIKSDAFKHLMKCSPKYLSGTSTGELITIVDNYTGEALNFFLKNFIHNINNFLNVVFCMVYILIISWKLGLIVMILIPISVAISKHFGEKLREYADEKQKRYSKYTGRVFELLNSLRDIKLLASQKKVFGDFTRDNKTLIRLNVKSALTEMNAKSILNGSQFLLQLLLFLALTYFAFVNEITIGSMLVVLAYYADVKLCVGALVTSHLDAKMRIEFIKKLYDFTRQPEEADMNEGENLILTNGTIQYNNVCFQYDEKPLLKNITLQIKRGKKVGIVGKSGSGKSTLIYMLMRFYEPQKGNIQIDNTPIDKVSLFSLRKNIGIVLQETFLFNATIRENILLGQNDVLDYEVFQACERAGIAEFIRTLPEQLDTMIGDGGRGISGGQSQRIAIARIYLQNPEIIIFDESTSSLDDETEQSIFDAWSEVLRGKTTIIIAHRLNSILQCDEAIVIKDGEIYEIGDPKELLLHSDYFKQVFAKVGNDV